MNYLIKYVYTKGEKITYHLRNGYFVAINQFMKTTVEYLCFRKLIFMSNTDLFIEFLSRQAINMTVIFMTRKNPQLITNQL
jgi:hypothetical protein